MLWIIFAILLWPTYTTAIGQPHYECGEHGRFEYCIDGIPGCIVGCHCHPGYYFDTETKICEPNAKLVHEYRRLYSGSLPTRVPDVFGPSNGMISLDLPLTASTLNPIDARVENIDKEQDDLGDWLYNQFFKTIESQVINNTDNKASEKPPTRRSGTNSGGGSEGPPMTKLKPKRRMGKKKKGVTKKEKKKKNDLRRKLLRITEDDSLFDSSSGSSTEDDSSSTESESEESSRSSDGDTTAEHGEKGHGHRKILMFNKKPKPPLPSFIFLPHMDTPFFPPIGLPAPMYPMVPVPPMPVFPPFYGGPRVEKDCSTSKSDVSSSTVPDQSSSSVPPEPAANDTTTTTNATVVVPDPAPSNGTNGFRSGKRFNAKRQKMLRHLQRMKANRSYADSQKKRKPPDIPPDMRPEIHPEIHPDMQPEIHPDMQPDIPMPPEMPLDVPPEFDSPFLDEGVPMNSQIPLPPMNEPPPPPPRSPDVDFKYLTQLIHKMDNGSHNVMNGTNNLPYSRRSENLMRYAPQHRYEKPYSPDLTSRRYLEAPNESYYSKLGQEIATLIRKLDRTGERRVNIELERKSPIQPPIFSENSYAPRSYWERSVRSLLKRLQPDDYYPQKIYEDNLFNLEAKVETVASTTHSLSLSELENAIFLMDETKDPLQRNSGPSKSTTAPIVTEDSEDNLNINLLPRQYVPPRPVEHLKPIEYNLRGPVANVLSELVKNHTNAFSQYIKTQNGHNNINGYLVHNLKKIPIKITPTNAYNRISDFKNVHEMLPDFKDTKPKIPGYVSPIVKFPDFQNIAKLNWKPVKNISQTYKNDNIANLQRLVGDKLNEVRNSQNKLPNMPWLSPKIASLLENRDPRSQQHIHSPVSFKFQVAPRRFNIPPSPSRYTANNNYQYHHRSLFKPPPSYFHHEIQHFDFFDT